MDLIHFLFFFDNMSLLNEKIKDISLVELLLLFILLFISMGGLKFLNLSFNFNYVYLVIIVYFIFKFRNSFFEFKQDLLEIFSQFSFKSILLIVLLNVFFSYGMLYLSNYLVRIVNLDNNYLGLFFSSMTLNSEILGIMGLLSVVLISPIVEELIFRGVFLNKLRLIVPTIFAVLISSLLFASLHSFGSIISAFVFAICMAILYLKSENILVPIFAHFLNNAIGESLYHLDSSQILFKNDLVVAGMSILAIISFILLLKFIFSNLNNFK